MGHDYEEEEDEQEGNRGLVPYYQSPQQYPQSGILSDRLLFAIACLTVAMIICTFASWATWGTLSKVIAAIGSAFSGFLGGFGQVAPLIGLVIGLAIAIVPLIIVAWFAGHLYISLKARSIRSRTFTVNPEVNNYGALYDDRRGIFIQPEAGELPLRVPTVPQTYSPHITYQNKGGTTVYEEEEELYENDDQQGLLPPPGSVQRHLIEELVRVTAYNSMRVPIGRSLTTRETVELDIESGHILVIGITQKGKSSWIASHLDVITRTHDRDHILLSILDLENKTGKLFEDLPHLIRIETRPRKIVKMHARDVHQVAEYIGYLRDEMDRRYLLDEIEQEQQPFVLIYFEEFLSFRRSTKISAEVRDKAFNDFAELAKRGLKVRMKLLASAQLNYAAKEEDVKEAMGNFDTYVAFSVKPDAARAAGMICTDLLNANFEAKKEGQFVIESSEINDIVLSPDYPLKQKLLEYTRAKIGQTTVKELPAPSFQGADETSTKQERNEARKESRNGQEDTLEANSQHPLHSKVIQVMEIPGETMKECIIRVWNVKPGDSDAYRQAKAEYEQVQRIIHSMAKRGMEIYQAGEQEV